MNGNTSGQSNSTDESQLKKELSHCQEEVERMKIEMKQNQESNRVCLPRLYKIGCHGFITEGKRSFIVKCQATRN